MELTLKQIKEQIIFKKATKKQCLRNIADFCEARTKEEKETK